MIETDKWIARYLGLAREISTWSKDPSRQIGAVAVSTKGQVLATGYNGFPRGVLDTPERYNDRPTKHRFVVHAEMNCIYNATYNGVSLDGATIYVWGLPMCSECAKGVAQVGIKKVFWAANQDIPPTWVESLVHTKQILDECDVTIERIEI